MALFAALAIALVILWAGDARPDDQIVDAGMVDAYAFGSVTTFDTDEFHLVRTGIDEFVALSWSTPGGGCTIPWRPAFDWGGAQGWFRDGCSGSTFNRAGVRVFGPAPRNLDRYPVTLRDGQISVDTSSYVCGFAPPGAECIEPSAP